MKDKKILILFLLISCLTLYPSLRILKSYQQQTVLISDINNGKYDFNDRIDEIEIDFPNVSVTSMNMSAVKARYLIHNKEYSQALNLLNKVKYDPLSMVNAQKAEVFFMQSKLDSMLLYSKKAFELLPNNSAHAAWYFIASAKWGQYDKIIELFNTYKNKMTDYKWAYFYFATMQPQSGKFGGLIKDQAKWALDKFNNIDNQEFQIILYYCIFGKKNFKNSLENFEQGNSFFKENKFEQAAIQYKKARNDFPINPEYFYNEMVAHFKLKNPDKTVETYLEMKDSINPKTGKFEHLIARGYLSVNDTLNACKYFSIAGNLNFSSSRIYTKNICNN